MQACQNQFGNDSDCDYVWYCTIDYSIILVSIIFSIIFNDFLAISHQLWIIDYSTACGEKSSVLDLLLSMWEVPVWFSVKEYVFSFDMQQQKGEDNLKLVPNTLMQQ